MGVTARTLSVEKSNQTTTTKSKLSTNYIIFYFNSKIALQPIRYVVKMLAAKMLMAKIVDSKKSHQRGVCLVL